MGSPQLGEKNGLKSKGKSKLALVLVSSPCIPSLQGAQALIPRREFYQREQRMEERKK